MTAFTLTCSGASCRSVSSVLISGMVFSDHPIFLRASVVGVGFGISDDGDHVAITCDHGDLYRQGEVFICSFSSAAQTPIDAHSGPSRRTPAFRIPAGTEGAKSPLPATPSIPQTTPSHRP